MTVQTPDGQRVLCGGCGRRARSKGRREVCLRDAPPAGGRPLRVLWNKRVWACADAGCGIRTWTDQAELAGPRAGAHRRGGPVGRRQTGRRGGVSVVFGPAARCGVAHGVVGGRGCRPAAGRRSRPGGSGRPGGFDETVMASATRRRRRRFVTAAVDAATGQVIDIFDGRDAADLRRWLQAQPRWWTEAVEVVCTDPHEGYRSAVASLLDSGHLPAGTEIAADPFHIVRLANQAITRCRQRTQAETTGHRGRKGRPALRDPQALVDRRRAPRRPRLPVTAIGLGPRRSLRRGCRLLGSQTKSPVRVQHRRPRTSRTPPRRRHRLVRRPRVRPRAAPPRHHPGPMARRDHNQHPHPHTQRAHRGRQRQNQRRQTLRPRLPQPAQLPALHTPGSRTKTTRNSTRHKNQNPTSQLRRVELI